MFVFAWEYLNILTLISSILFENTDTKVKEQNSEDGEPKLQMSCPTTPPSGQSEISCSLNQLTALFILFSIF